MCDSVNDLDPTSRIKTDDSVTPVRKHPVLTVLQGESVGLTLKIEHDRTIIGRGASADLVLNDQVAAKHYLFIATNQPSPKRRSVT